MSMCQTCWRDNCKSVCEEDFMIAKAKIVDRDAIIESMKEAARIEGKQISDLKAVVEEAEKAFDFHAHWHDSLCPKEADIHEELCGCYAIKQAKIMLDRIQALRKPV